MRKIVAVILYFFFRFKIKRLIKHKVSLSIYGHNPTRKSFEKLMVWLLGKGFVFISSEELSRFENKEIPPKVVWLSFDDGWKNNYYDVLPVLEKYRIPATFFIATKGVEDGYFWFSKAYQNRISPFYDAVQALWEMKNSERKAIVLKLPNYTGDRVVMNRDELRKLSDSPYVTIGNHTHDHVICDRCSELELIEEIRLCEEFVKNCTGNECFKIFSYPNGNRDAKTVTLIKQSGYQMAPTTNNGFLSTNDMYSISRNEMKNDASLYENILQVFGIWTPLIRKLKTISGIETKK